MARQRISTLKDNNGGFNTKENHNAAETLMYWFENLFSNADLKKTAFSFHFDSRRSCQITKIRGQVLTGWYGELPAKGQHFPGPKNTFGVTLIFRSVES